MISVLCAYEGEVGLVKPGFPSRRAGQPMQQKRVAVACRVTLKPRGFEGGVHYELVAQQAALYILRSYPETAH
jgi:hypothetical protein